MNELNHVEHYHQQYTHQAPTIDKPVQPRGKRTTMNTINSRRIFASAYRQLSPVERRYVDDYVRTLERKADREQQRLSNYLQLPVSDDVYDASNGMLDRPMVTAAITERVMEITADRELSPERLIKEYVAIAFASMGDYIEIDSFGIPSLTLDKCTPEQKAAIKKVTFEQTNLGAVRLNIELHDKLKSMDTLAKYMGMVEPDNPHWRVNNANPVIDHTASVAQAADAYAALLGE